MRTIKQIHTARYAPISDLITYSALPSATVDYLDPFLFLNHHGLQKYPARNNGLPFGPHPHRGMETVTFILEGDIAHKDSGGHASVMTAGGVQWMTAGSGLIHAEVSSDEFKKTGGDLEILQLWINLPAALKMTKPAYKGLQREDIPSLTLDEGKVTLNLISGTWEGTSGPFETLTDVFMSTLYLRPGGTFEAQVPAERTIFLYVVRGKVVINGTDAQALHLVEFGYDEDELRIEASEDSVLLFGHAKPFEEPVVAQGPFVMNTQEEIIEAYSDYRAGKFGTWRG
ncbi:hypothetical protein HNQ92_005779 [Rhabdobacter roseus]|uniref:Pirin family protein n=1 Tax=Rhabdobacter roseus TaxID=1655419 RepID=A0A840U1Z3_9BACT|nr:pirin family protein [Rhabdobacter roseus]MBB5287613.1 hypothetical protein [Rhabdobacter roseus]